MCCPYSVENLKNIASNLYANSLVSWFIKCWMNVIKRTRLNVSRLEGRGELLVLILGCRNIYF